MLDKFKHRLKVQNAPLPGYARQVYPIPGMAPLHAAVLMGHVEAARLLLESGADVEQKKGQFRSTPLMEAAQGGRIEMAQLLIECGADIHAMNISGETALYHARSFAKNPELTAYLAAISEAVDRVKVGTVT